MTKRVKGPTDHVVVVGAGLGGLSAALRLAGAGRKVTVVEREAVPGGRNGLLNKDGYAFDTGPSVLTMPSLIQDAFSCVGEDLKDWLELMPLSPLYRAFYADGSQIDVHADTARMEEEIRTQVSAEEALGYRKYVDFVTKLYKYEMNDFIDKNIDSPFNLLTPNLAKLIALGGFRHLQPKVNQYLKDPRLQRVYSFQAMYAGVSPQQALAIYAVIAYMDSVNGVFFPKGGMHAVPRALAAAATKHGVEFKYNTTVTGLDKQNGRVKAVLTDTGERIECDVVVMNHFGESWDGVFDELIEKKQLMSDPSVLVTVPTHDDASLAPAGKQSYYVLFPTPNLTADIDWKKQAGPYRDSMIKTLEDRGYTGFGDAIETEVMTTPLDWQAQGMEQGAPFASAHTFFQTGPFRPRNMAAGFENVVFAGSGTQPGVGVPMVLISGRLAAERIVGPVK
jgi:phytoene desaturase